MTSLNVWTVVWRSSRASSPSSRTSSGAEPRSNSTTAKSWTSCRRRSPTETKSTNRSKSNECNKVKLHIMSASKVILVNWFQKAQTVNQRNKVKLLIMSASKVILIERVQKTQIEVSATCKLNYYCFVCNKVRRVRFELGLFRARSNLTIYGIYVLQKMCPICKLCSRIVKFSFPTVVL
jgi:hypothetical protein